MTAADPGIAGEGSETPAPPATPPPPGSTPLSTWEQLRESLPDELKSSPSLQGITSLQNLVQQHANAQHLIHGEKIPRPKEESPQEDWDRFYNTIGRPESAEKYDLGDFAPPEGMPWDPEMQKQALEDLHAAGLTNKQVNQVLRAFAARQGEAWKGALSDFQTARNEAEASLRTEWGSSFPAKVETARKTWKAHFGEFADTVAKWPAPDGGVLGDHPVFVKAFARIGEATGEDKLIGGKVPGDPALTPAQAQAEIDAIESDPEFPGIVADKSKHKHPKYVRWNQLMDIANS